MIDYAAALRSLMEATAALSAEFGGRIYAERTFPPEGYVLTDGPALVFAARGGALQLEPVPGLQEVSIQIRTYGATPAIAAAAFGVVVSALDRATGGDIRAIRFDQLAQSATTPTTNWPFAFGFATVWAKA